jgi:hypothetical protein
VESRFVGIEIDQSGTTLRMEGNIGRRVAEGLGRLAE